MKLPLVKFHTFNSSQRLLIVAMCTMCVCMHTLDVYMYVCTYISLSFYTQVELKQISESIGYPYYPDSDPEPFRIVANYFKQFEIDFELSILFIATESV